MSILSSIPLTARIGDYGGGMYSKDQYNAYRPGAHFFEYNGKTLYFNLDSEEDYRKAYNSSPALKSVINRRAQYFVNGKYQVLNSNNDNKLRGEQAKKLQALLDKPNLLQTGKQFKAQQNIYIDLYGYCPVLKISPVGFPTEVNSMWNIPPWLFDVEFHRVKFWDLTKLNSLKDVYKKFSIKWDGATNELDKDAVFLILDNTISTDSDGNLHLPDSRLKGLEYPVSNDVAVRQAANTSIVRKGPSGILSNNPGNGQYAPIKVGAERAEIQRDFRRYGLTGQEWQIIITDAALQWQQMGSPVKDMQLWETITDAQQAICDGIGIYPYLMAGGGKSTTFNNLNEAKKSQYQDFIIPDDEARTEQLSEGLIPTEEKPYITVDYSHVEALQESEKIKAENTSAQADAFKKMYDLGIMTRNDMLVAQGLPKNPDPTFDLYSFQVKPAVDPNAPAPGDPAQKENV